METILQLPGSVYGVGPESVLAAQTYATLTGRPYRYCGDSNDLITETNDVVFCTTTYLSAKLMYRLFVDCKHDGIPGLICAHSSTELEQVCRRQMQRLVSPQSESLERIFIRSMASFGSVKKGKDTYLGSMAARDELAKVLLSNPAMLVVMGRTTGFDISLTPRQWACALVDHIHENDEPLPICQQLGQCTLFPSMPNISDAVAKGWLIPLAKMRADVGLFSSCSLTRVYDGYFDPSYSLGPALLRQSNFGALITTWRREFDPGSRLSNLVNDICAGTMVGIAIHTFNRSPIARDLGMNLCLLGDPCFAIARSTSFSPLTIVSPSRESVKAQSPLTTSDPTVSQAQLMQAAIEELMRDDPHFDLPKGKAIVEKLSHYLECREPGTCGGKSPRLSELDDALLDYVKEFPILTTIFGSFMRMGESSEDEVCASCGAPSRRFHISFPEYGAVSLKVISCPCCSDSSVLPSDWQMKLDLSKVSDRVLSVSGVPEGAGVLVCLNVIPTGALYKTYSWTPASGAPTSFKLPEELPNLPLYCQVIIGHCLKLGTLGFKLLPPRNSGVGCQVGSGVELPAQ